MNTPGFETILATFNAGKITVIYIYKLEPNYKLKPYPFLLTS